MSKFRQTVWVDLDATLARYDRWKGIRHIGEPLDGAKEFMERLQFYGAEMGFAVGVFTTRTKPDMPGREDVGIPATASPDETSRALALLIRDWLDAHKIPFDEIYCGHGKPPGLAYVDDRGVSCRPQEDGPAAYENAIRQVKGLAQLHG